MSDLWQGGGLPGLQQGWSGTRSFLMNRSAVQYNPAMREWLAQYKFRGHESMGPLLAQMMNYAMRAMAEELREKSAASWDFFDVVTFVPVSEERMLERGFNQSRALAYGAASAARAPVLELLGRSRHTEKQSSKNRRQRLLELEGVYLPLPDALDKLKGFLLSKHLVQYPVRLLLIDDVYTTGSTMDTCASVLQGLCRELGRSAEIYSLTWARS
ncbi:ComF family protein [Paenibacillus sp. D2_2]|uniref:ComF family protein n=1 Tax=Paenibacillus sp. D2_2 TaxID=3073092 RepID=UPI0028163D94|nr:ComF family protein [Paenibacillus sp. D2_2]WMT40668.1 ComF family protein [Paenibacillus sp. D2_2]